jgi:hypothetical protein
MTVDNVKKPSRFKHGNNLEAVIFDLLKEPQEIRRTRLCSYFRIW